MKVLITGGAGFIGSNHAYFHFARHPDDELFVLDKLTYAGNLDNLSGLMNSERFHFVEGDINDKSFIDSFFEKEKFDLVINFAAESHVDRSISGPRVFVETNVLGTQTLLDAARMSQVSRFHQISTDEVYGDLELESDELFTEATPLAPNSPYASSKASADLLCRSYFETFKMPITISRCSNNYGPYQFPEKLIPYFFRLLADNKPVPVYGDGKHVRDWLYVGDHCSAVDRIIESGRPGDVYNIGGNNEKSNMEITKKLLSFMGKDEGFIRYVDDRLGHDRRYAIDASKMRDELGWEPIVSFDEGLELTFNWYRENEAWVRKLLDRLEERQHKEISETPLKAAKS
ncbi:dTDP-glucose 4,6-dehydratase [Candidatus Peregrinibacteria bacterium]|nr:dTDP-glucose 4,6-dehydratase [Candidatus Peregrinibacteria bacterium]